MRVIEDMYDARFIHEKNHSARKEEKLQKSKASNSLDLSIEEDSNINNFPVFVVQRLTTVVGLKSLTDQIGWDLLCNIDRNYKEYPEIETFKHFLQEKFNNDDLLFFLYVRSIISKILRINFSARWILVHGPERQPKTLYLTYSECIQISHKIFGISYSKIRKQFLASITSSKKLIGMINKKGEDTRKIDVRDILHLSTMGFRRSQAGLDMPHGRDYKKSANYDNNNDDNNDINNKKNNNDKNNNSVGNYHIKNNGRKNDSDYVRNQSTSSGMSNYNDSVAHSASFSNNVSLSGSGGISPSSNGFDFSSPNPSQNHRKKNILNSKNSTSSNSTKKLDESKRDDADITWTDSVKNLRRKNTGSTSDNSPMYTPGMSVSEDENQNCDDVDFTWSQVYKNVRDVNSTDNSPCYSSRLEEQDNNQRDGMDFTWGEVFMSSKGDDIIELCESPGKRRRPKDNNYDNYNNNNSSNDNYNSNKYEISSNDEIDYTYNEAFKDIMGKNNMTGKNHAGRLRLNGNNPLQKNEKENKEVNGKGKGKEKVEKNGNNIEKGGSYNENDVEKDFSYSHAFQDFADKDVVRGRSPARVRNSQNPTYAREMIKEKLDDNYDNTDFTYSQAFKDGSGKEKDIMKNSISPPRLRKPLKSIDESYSHVQKSTDDNTKESNDVDFTYSQAFNNVRDKDNVPSCHSPSKKVINSDSPKRKKNSVWSDVDSDSDNGNKIDKNKQKKKLEKSDKDDKRKHIDNVVDDEEEGEVHGRGRGSERGRERGSENKLKSSKESSDIEKQHNPANDRLIERDITSPKTCNIHVPENKNNINNNDIKSKLNSSDSRDADTADDNLKNKRRNSLSNDSTGKIVKNKKIEEKSRRVTVSPKVCQYLLYCTAHTFNIIFLFMI